MSYVSYQKCDICGETMTRTWYKIEPKLVRMFHKDIYGEEDICQDCLEKFKKLIQDKKTEEDICDELLSKREKVCDTDAEAQYWQGVEDALACLSHRRLK